MKQILNIRNTNYTFKIHIEMRNYALTVNSYYTYIYIKVMYTYVYS